MSKLYLDDPTTNGGHLRPMSSEHHIDRKRGTKDARQQLALLREKWPVAFPAEPKSVRPLEIGAAGEIASAMGWSLPYTLGVLARWKMAPAYCRAVLAQEYRIALDGSPAEAIDAKAKDLAAKRLARLAERETANETAKPRRRCPWNPSLLKRHPRRQSNCAPEYGRRSCGEGRSRLDAASHGAVNAGAQERNIMTQFYQPDLGQDIDSPFARDGANKLVRRSYWLDMDDRTLVMVMVNGIGRNLTNDEKRAHLADLGRAQLIDQVCIQQILPPEK